MLFLSILRGLGFRSEPAARVTADKQGITSGTLERPQSGAAHSTTGVPRRNAVKAAAKPTAKAATKAKPVTAAKTVVAKPVAAKKAAVAKPAAKVAAKPVTKAVTQWNSCTLAIPSQAAGRQEMSRDPAAAKRPTAKCHCPAAR